MTLTEYNQKLRSGYYMRRYFKVTGTCWGNLFPTTLEFSWDARGIVDFLSQPYIRDRFVHIDSVVETQPWDMTAVCRPEGLTMESENE